MVIGYSLNSRTILCDVVNGSSLKKILICGAFHGLEGITSSFIEKFYNELLEKKIIPSASLYFVPCVNPDGVEISKNGPISAGIYKELVEKIGFCDRWQANARGVDINHNFDANWDNLRKMEVQNGITGPSYTRYGGERAESEPETQAIVNLCLREKFDISIAFHSQGEEIYWNFDGIIPKHSEFLAKKMSEISGYSLSSPEGLAVGGGFKDWFIKKFNKPGFTIEIGKGKNPLPLSDLDSIYEKLRPMMLDIVKNADEYLS